jgi:hypothetical protein
MHDDNLHNALRTDIELAQIHTKSQSKSNHIMPTQLLCSACSQLVMTIEPTLLRVHECHPLPRPGWVDCERERGSNAGQASTPWKAGCPEDTPRDLLIGGRRLWWLAVLVLLAVTTGAGSAQVMAPPMRIPLRISTFVMFTDAKPHFQYYDDRAVWGATAGGIVQLPRIGGLEARGSILRWGGLSHQESALAGPRFALHFGKVSPYASALFGAGNAWWWSNPPTKNQPPPRLVEAIGFEWSAVGGVDLHLGHRISWRVGELSYGRIYAKTKTLTPLTASSGIVFRIN